MGVMKRAAIAGVFLAIWGVGLVTLAPSCPHGDSGETAGVALHLGIAHPPGYPLPTILGNLLVRLVPVGSVAWRVSLLSLAAAAVSASLIAAAVMTAGPAVSPALAFVLGVCGGLALEVWNQMTLPKGSVYTVTIAFLGAAAFCLARLEGGGRWLRWLALAGLAVGLSLDGHFPMVAAFGPFLLAAAVLAAWRKRGGRRALALAGVFCALGLSVYLYIPLRAGSAHPMFRWAEPTTWKRFNWLVLRQQYMFIEKTSREGNGRLLARRFADRVERAFGPAGLILAGLGVGGAILGRRRWVLAFAAGGCAEVAAAAFYPKLEPDALWVADPFFSAGWYALAMVMMWGLATAAGFPGRWWRVAAAAAAVAVTVRETGAGFSIVSKRWNYLAPDQQANLAATLPRGSLLFCEGDAYIAPLLYGLYVDGQRPDVRMIIPIFLHGDLSWGLRQLKEQYPDLRTESLGREQHIWLKAKDIMENHADRPWTYTLTTSSTWPFGPYAEPYGLVYRIRGPEEEDSSSAVDRGMFRYRLRGTMGRSLSREPFERVVRDNYVRAYFNRAIYRRTRKDRAMSLAHFERARLLGSPEAALNAGLYHYEDGDLGRAAKCWRQARNLAPERPEPYVNLALIALHRRPPRPDEAIGLCEKAIAARDDFGKAYEVMANAFYLKGELPRAMDNLRRAMDLSPGDARLPVLLERMRSR